MTLDEALLLLLNHKDGNVNQAALVIRDTLDRKKRVVSLIEESLIQLRLDMKYLIFDLEATRRERDSAMGKL